MNAVDVHGKSALVNALGKSAVMVEAIAPFVPRPAHGSSGIQGNITLGPDDPVGCLAYAVKVGSHIPPFGRKELGMEQSWAFARVVRPLTLYLSSGDAFNVMFKIKDVALWKWASSEPQFQQHPLTENTLLHVVCMSEALSQEDKLEVIRDMKRDCRVNPFLLNFDNERAVEVATDPRVKEELRAYTKWHPHRQAMYWFGPLFRRRVFALLLVLQRLGMSRICTDVRHLLVQHVLQAEHIYVRMKK